MKIDWQLLRFPFDDPRWQNKALVGILLGIGSMFLFPISLLIALPVSGYSLRLMRRVIQGSDPSLPEWDDWNDLFSGGVKAWAVGFVYSLPMLVLMCCMYGSFFLVIPFAAFADSSPRMAVAAFGGMMLVYAIAFFLVALMMLVMIPTIYFAMVALTRLAATGSLNSAFQFREVIQLGRKGLPNYLLATVGLCGVLAILYIIVMAISYTIVLLCLLPVLAGAMVFYGSVLSGALFGKAYFHTELSPAAAESRLTPPPVATSPLVEKPRKPRAAPKKKEAE